MSRGAPVVLMNPGAGSDGELTQFPIAPVTYGPVSGMISQVNQQLVLPCVGASAVLIYITGTFAGTLQVTGSIDGGNVNVAPRRLYKAGTGPIEVSTVTSDGSAAMAREYRVVPGGADIRVTSTAWTSGSAVITIVASGGDQMVFVNGPVHTTEEAAVRAGRGYQASTGNQAVSSGNYLNVVLANPAGSGVNLILEKARFLATVTTLAYVQQNDTTTVPTGTSATANRLIGGPASIVTCKTQMTTTPLAGTSTSGAPIVNGDVELSAFKILPPGHSIGYSVGGANGGVFTGAAAQIAILFAWIEETTN